MSDTPCALSGTTLDSPIIQQGLCSTATESLLLEKDKLCQKNKLSKIALELERKT